MAMFGLVPVKNGQKVRIYWTCQNVRLPPPYPALLPRPPPSASFFSFCPGGFNVTQCKYYVFLSLALTAGESMANYMSRANADKTRRTTGQLLFKYTGAVVF